jgi:hypothetical protein
MLTERNADVCKIDVGTSASNSSAFSFANHASGMILVPASEGAINLTFFASDEENGTYRAVTPNDSDTPISIATQGGRAKEFPPQLFGCHWLKIVASAISGGSSIKYTITLKA